jgi:hypothetical protein
MNAPEMLKHADCIAVCQQADAFGVWPMYQCQPVCVWLKYGPTEQERADEYQREQIATAQSEAAQEAAHKEFSK